VAQTSRRAARLGLLSMYAFETVQNCEKYDQGRVPAANSGEVLLSSTTRGSSLLVSSKEKLVALPTSYLTSSKNLEAIFDAIRNAKAPEKFTTRFLESLDFKSAADRLIIGVLKALGFLDAEGRPQERYFRFLDQTQSAVVLAEAIEDAYADLYQTNKQAHALSKADIVNKFKTLSQGQLTESVLDKAAMTFLALAKLADFDKKKQQPERQRPPATTEQQAKDDKSVPPPPTSPLLPMRSLGGLHYNIQIILPDSRDPKVYDALFRSLKEHLLQ
jgi:hypothetical protein